jgi:hypothetical protein
MKPSTDYANMKLWNWEINTKKTYLC